MKTRTTLGSCLRSFGLLAVIVLGAFGCSSDPPKVELANLPGPPGASVEGDNLKVAPGQALIVDAFPKESDGDALDAIVDIIAAPPFEVFRAKQKNRFVITASSAGQASLRVVVDGQDIRTINANAE